MSSSKIVPLVSKLAYGVGDFAGILVFTTVSTFLMFYYTDVYGLPAAAVGGLLFAARTVDAVWDIFLGVVVDRTRSRWGQCRPYLLFGGPLLAALAVAVFTSVDGSAAFKLAYAYVTYIGLMMAYSLVTIPYGAMPALMTDQMRDRNRMIMIRTVFSYASALLINTQTLKLVAWLGGGNKQVGYQHTVLLMAVASIVLYWLCFAGTRESVKPLVQPMHVRRDLGTLVRGRAWLMMTVMCMSISMAFTIVGGSTLYYFTYVVRDTSGMALFFLMSGLGMITGILCSDQLTRRFCKRQVLLWTSLAAALLYSCFYFVDTSHLWQMVGLAFVINLMGGCTHPIIISMIPDVADDAELRSGRRMVGLTSSTIAFSVKFGLGLGGAFTGLLLTWLGYKANVVQSAQVVDGFKMIMSAVPALNKLLVFGIAYFYPLNQARLETVQRELMVARAAA